MPRLRPIGESLVELTERLPTVDIDDIWTADVHHPAEAAVDTPFLARMRALLSAIDADDGTGVSVEHARRTLREAAPTAHLQPGPPDLFELDLLVGAMHRELLRCSETEGDIAALLSPTATVARGSQAQLVVGHPLAALVEPWIDQMMRDPVADLDCDPRLRGPWIAVPAMFVQLLARAGAVDLTEVARVIADEAGDRADGVRLPWPLPHAVVALATGLCVEFGMASWGGDVETLGRAEITPLGLWAEIALRAHIDGELPPGYAKATMPEHTWN